MRLFTHYRSRLKVNWLEIVVEVDPHNVEVFDSTTITLFKAVLKGAGQKPLKGEKKGGVKAFAKTNLSECVPNFICIRPAATNENMFLKVIQPKEFSIAAVDKRYNRYLSFAKWTDANRDFVTRKKDNAEYGVMMDFECTHSPHIVGEQLILFKYKKNGISQIVKVLYTLILRVVKNWSLSVI